jgi:hypothetical protein
MSEIEEKRYRSYRAFSCSHAESGLAIIASGITFSNLISVAATKNQPHSHGQNLVRCRAPREFVSGFIDSSRSVNHSSPRPSFARVLFLSGNPTKYLQQQRTVANCVCDFPETYSFDVAPRMIKRSRRGVT